MSPWWVLWVALLLAIAAWYYLGRFFSRWFFPAISWLPGATVSPKGWNVASCVVGQVALLLGGGVFIGIPLASFWGWGPVVLWLLIGGFGICGLIAAGLHFLDGRYPIDGFSVVSEDLLGRHGSRLLALLLQVAATLIHTLLLVVASQLMALFPVAASLVLLHWLPFLLPKKIRLHSGAYTIVALAVLWLLTVPIASFLPLRLAGEIQLLTGGDSQFTVQASSLWLLVLVVLNGYLLRQGDTGVVLYRLTAGVMCVLLLLSGMLGLLAFPAIMVLPRIAAIAPAPLLPGLLIALPTTTLGAWYMVCVVGSSRSQQRISPVQSYAGIIVVVMLALVLLVLIGSGDVQTAPLAWQPQQSLQYALSAALVRIAGLISRLGLPAASSLGLAGFTTIVLLMAALQAGLRGQSILFNDTIRGMGTGRGMKTGWVRVYTLPLMAFTAGLALFILPGRGLATLWMIWGVASALVSAGLLAMIGLALSRQHRAGGVALSLGLLVWSIGQWAGLLGLLQHTGNWQPFELLDAVLLLLGCWLLLACLQSWWKLRIAVNRTPRKTNLLLR
ncbi:MAG TPA: hypothetical protein ENI62_08675 [Gammaproteobacteria bacterium]|nr:hypothetical protein [Gammaproteobacteria bacterium]